MYITFLDESKIVVLQFRCAEYIYIIEYTCTEIFRNVTWYT